MDCVYSPAVAVVIALTWGAVLSITVMLRLWKSVNVFDATDNAFSRERISDSLDEQIQRRYVSSAAPQNWSMQVK